jgi:hypothetical protein
MSATGCVKFDMHVDDECTHTLHVYTKYYVRVNNYKLSDDADV